MIQQWLNGKTLLFLIAISIVTGTIFYSRYLSQKIATDEKRKVDLWVEAQRTIRDATDQVSLNLAARISSENKEIPIIETDENDHINPNNCVNLDSFKIKTDKPGIEVSWQVTGIRHDKFAEKHPVIPELDKEPENKGYYLHAEELGKPASKSIDNRQKLQKEPAGNANRQ